jgi:hypothetical protein
MPVEVRACLGEYSRLLTRNIGSCSPAILEFSPRSPSCDVRWFFDSRYVDSEVGVSFGVEAQELRSAYLFWQSIEEFVADPRQFGLWFPANKRLQPVKR